MTFPPMFQEWCRRKDRKTLVHSIYQQQPSTKRKRGNKQTLKMKNCAIAAIAARKQGKDYEPGIAVKKIDPQEPTTKESPKYCPKCTLNNHCRSTSKKCRFNRQYHSISDWLNNNTEGILVACCLDDSSSVCVDCGDGGHENKSSLRCKKHPIFGGDTKDWQTMVDFVSCSGKIVAHANHVSYVFSGTNSAYFPSNGNPPAGNPRVESPAVESRADGEIPILEEAQQLADLYETPLDDPV